MFCVVCLFRDIYNCFQNYMGKTCNTHNVDELQNLNKETSCVNGTIEFECLLKNMVKFLV